MLARMCDITKQRSSPGNGIVGGHPPGTACRILLSFPFPSLEELQGRLSKEGLGEILPPSSRGTVAAAAAAAAGSSGGKPRRVTMEVSPRPSMVEGHIAMLFSDGEDEVGEEGGGEGGLDRRTSSSSSLAGERGARRRSFLMGEEFSDPLRAMTEALGLGSGALGGSFTAMRATASGSVSLEVSTIGVRVTHPEGALASWG